MMPLLGRPVRSLTPDDEKIYRLVGAKSMEQSGIMFHFALGYAYIIYYGTRINDNEK